ncbi:MAG: hypothetical protein WCL18_09890 [bacterium]
MSLVQGTKFSTAQVLKTERKSGSYVLRSSIHKARVSHFCCCCMKHIQSGETYENVVRAMGNRLTEFKTHYNPACEFPEDPIEKYEAKDQKDDIKYKEAA